MTSTKLLELEQDIEKMEKQLSSLYQQRVKLLEGILAEAKQAEKAVTSQVPTKSAPKEKAKTSTRSKTKSQKKKSAKNSTQKAAAPLSTKVIHERLQKAVKAGGNNGLSAMEISKASQVNYKTTLRNLKKMKNLFTQTGEGSSARYKSAK